MSCDRAENYFSTTYKLTIENIQLCVEELMYETHSLFLWCVSLKPVEKGEKWWNFMQNKIQQ